MTAPNPRSSTLDERYAADSSCPKFAHDAEHLRTTRRAGGFPVLAKRPVAWARRGL